MSKVNIGIKTTKELYDNIHGLLDSAKRLGKIKEKNEYFEITYPFFEEYMIRKELTETELGNTLNEVERATTIIIKQFMGMIESHENIVKLKDIKMKEILSKKDQRIDTLTSLLEKTEQENIRLKKVDVENAVLKKRIEELEEKINKMELQHEKELNRLDKEYVRKFTKFQSVFERKMDEVN